MLPVGTYGNLFELTVSMAFLLGVYGILVSLMAQKAEVKFDPAYIIPSQIANSISELGFPASVLDDAGVGSGEVELNVIT